MQLASAIFFVFIAFMQIRIDKKVWGTFVTPGAMLTGGYSLVIVIYGISVQFYDFREIGYETYWALTILTFFCIICSVVASVIQRWLPTEINLPIRDSGRLSLIVVLSTLVAFLPFAIQTSLVYGFFSTDSREELNHGVISHLHVLLSFAIIWYSVATQQSVRFRIVVIVASIAALSLYPVKGWTLIPMAAVVFASLLRGKSHQPTLKYFLVLVGGGTAIFFMIYIMRLDTLDADPLVFFGALEAILLHLVGYILAGIIGFDAILGGLKLQGSLMILFAPLHNMLAVLNGDSFLSPISDVYVQLRDSSVVGNDTNVYSYFGTIIGYGGIVFGGLLAILFLFIAYLSYSVVWRSRSAALRAAFLFIVAGFAFGWFEFYFSQLTFYEIPMLAFIFELLSRRWRRRGV